MIFYLLKGIIVGLAVSIPVGPIGIICIRKTIQEGRLAGFISGIGAALADTCYGVVAALGVSAISSFLITQAFWLKLLGGSFLLILGIKLFFTKVGESSTTKVNKGYFHNFFTTFLLTITNPTTVIAFLAIFAAIGLGDTHNTLNSSTYLVMGVFFGSASWWLILSSTVNLFQSKFTPKRMVGLNRLSGVLLFSFGVWAMFLSAL